MLLHLDSQTANVVTFFRAIAALNPSNQLLVDPYAQQFLPKYLKLALLSLRRSTISHQFFENIKLGGGVLIRARYAEECLKERVLSGTMQYIILGAGWDSFAFRCPSELEELEIFELDFPATQQKKIKRLKTLGIAVPNNVHFVPIDFESEQIHVALSQTSFDPNLDTFVTWQGVTYYLTEETIEQVLLSLSDLCSGRLDIVIDYIEQKYIKQWWRYQHFRWIYLAVAFIGERFVSGFDPNTFSDWLSERKFTLKEDHNYRTIADRLGSENMGHFRLSVRTHLAHIQKFEEDI